MKSREEILAKVDEITSNSFEDELSVEDEVKEILTTIAGDDETSMLSEADTADLLYSRDIYHYQSQAVRIVRKFLSEKN
jgi:hypothetical protein